MANLTLMQQAIADLVERVVQSGWEELVAGFAEFVAACRAAADLVKAGAVSVLFPEDCFPSRLPYVPPG